MFSETEAKEEILYFLNKDISTKAIFEIKSIRLSPRKDFWMAQADVVDPFPKPAGAWGYILDNNNGAVIVCGYDQAPQDYVQDIYDLEEAKDLSYVLINDPESSKSVIPKMKNTFGLNSMQALNLFKGKRHWCEGSKRHLKSIQVLMEDMGIPLKLNLVENPNPILKVKNGFYVKWDIVNELRKAI